MKKTGRKKHNRGGGGGTQVGGFKPGLGVWFFVLKRKKKKRSKKKKNETHRPQKKRVGGPPPHPRGGGSPIGEGPPPKQKKKKTQTGHTPNPKKKQPPVKNPPTPPKGGGYRAPGKEKKKKGIFRGVGVLLFVQGDYHPPHLGFRPPKKKKTRGGGPPQKGGGVWGGCLKEKTRKKRRGGEQKTENTQQNTPQGQNLGGPFCKRGFKNLNNTNKKPGEQTEKEGGECRGEKKKKGGWVAQKTPRKRTNSFSEPGNLSLKKKDAGEGERGGGGRTKAHFFLGPPKVGNQYPATNRGQRERKRWGEKGGRDTGGGVCGVVNPPTQPPTKTE